MIFRKAQVEIEPPGYFRGVPLRNLDLGGGVDFLRGAQPDGMRRRFVIVL